MISDPRLYATYPNAYLSGKEDRIREVKHGVKVVNPYFSLGYRNAWEAGYQDELNNPTVV